MPFSLFNICALCGTVFPFSSLLNLLCRCTTQMGSSSLNSAPTEKGTASSMLPQALLWMPTEISLLLTGATVVSRLAWENYNMSNAASKLVSLSPSHPSVLCDKPGVWQLRVLPVLYQHIGGPPVRPSGAGPHIWWACGGGGLWEPLLQSLPLPAVDRRLGHCKHWQRPHQCSPPGAI